MKVLVVGGNGFLGSAIVKQAVARQWKVVSISRSGKPFITPAGHQPAWSSSPSVSWRAADALDSATYQDAASECDAAITTTGILLESAYKASGSAFSPPSIGAAAGGPLQILQGLTRGWGMSRPPTAQASGSNGPSYETANRDAALAVARTFSATRSPTSTEPAPFLYISAEDIFRPIISQRYIDTKRQAEAALIDMADVENRIRPIFLRPGLMYHPQTRPLSTLPAAAIDLSSWLHGKHEQLGLPWPTPAGLLQRFPGADLSALSRLLTLPPLHVDTVAKAACQAVTDSSIRGPVGTTGIMRLAGFKDRTTAKVGLGMGAGTSSRPLHQRTFSTSARRLNAESNRGSAGSSSSGSASGQGAAAWSATAILIIGTMWVSTHYSSKRVHNEIQVITQQDQMRARATTQGIYAWGSNRYNVVAPDTPLTTFIKSPRSIPYFDGMALRDLSLEERHGVAVDANGDVMQWGLGFFDASLETINKDENLDDVPLARRREKEKANELTPRGSLGAQAMAPIRTLVGKDIVQVATSDEKIYALSSKGKVFVFSSVQARQWPGKPSGWSLNPLTLFGVFGTQQIDHEELNATPAAKLGRSERIVDIKAGSHHMLALSNKGRTFSSPIDHDGNAFGQLGLRRVLLGVKNEYREVLMEPRMLTQAEEPSVFHQGQVLPAWALPPGLETSSTTKKPVTGPANRGIFVRPKSGLKADSTETVVDVSIPVIAGPGVPIGVGPLSQTSSRDRRPQVDIRFCTALHEIPGLRDVKVAQVATGSDHSVARTTGGKVLGWGRQTHGQTGMGAQIALEAIPVPSEIVLSKAFPNSSVDIQCTDISAGADNTFFTMQRREPGGIGSGIKVDVLSVGKGQWGSLGNAMWNQVTVVPARVKTVSGLLEFSESTQMTHAVPIHTISVGKPGSVAIVLDTVEQEGHQAFGRDVMVFGHNAAYQLGTSKRSNLAVPQHLSPLPPPTIALGEAAPPVVVQNVAERLREADINSGVLTHMPHHRMQLASKTRADTHLAPRKADGKPGPKKRKLDVEETITTGAVSMAIYWRVHRD